MTSYPDYEVKDLATRARARIEMDEKYARETLEAYETKRRLRIDEIIIEVIQNFYGKVVYELVDQVKKLLPKEWF